jgi:hypothetical protein
VQSQITGTMGEAARNFLAQFHNLEGDTVKQKHQSLFHLLHRHSLLPQDEQELNFITENLQPNNHLEKIFRVDFLVYFRRFNELFEDYKNGDDITLSKVAKQDWFFQNVLKDSSAEKFVNDVLPTLSYSVKVKLLKKLLMDEKCADEIFTLLHKRYGIFLATVFLTKCTSDKISEVLKNHPIKLTVAQLQKLYDKDPSLICAYLEERTKYLGSSSFMNDNPIFKYIAQRNPKMFSDLFNKYKFEINLGHRTTKKYINSQKSTILSKPEPYLNVLNKNVTVRKLGPDIKNLLFEKADETSDQYWNSILKYFPKNQQFAIFKSTYNKIYHHKFGDNIDSVSDNMLKIIQDSEEREKLARMKLEKENQESYLKFVTTDYCLKQFMEKIQHMKSSERSDFVEIAVECCILNKDMDGLLKVCELVCTRFKNDDRRIRESFFYALTGTTEKSLDDLTDEHWKFVMEILAATNAKDEWIYNENAIRSKYVKYLVKNNKPIKEELLKYARWVDIFEDLSTWDDPKTLKPVLCELVEIGIIKPEPDDEYAAARYDCRLANICDDYNKKYPKITIDIHSHQRILQSVRQVLENETSANIYRDHISGIKYMICQKSSSEELHQLKKLYFKKFKTFGSPAACMWFLKHEPQTLQENYDEFLSGFVDVRGNNPKRLWRLIKKHCYLDLDKRTVEFCKLKLGEEGYGHKVKLVRALSMLSNPASHMEFMERYVPTSDKVDLSDDDVKDFYTIQSKLVGLLNLVQSPATVLPLTLQFCKGDYLRSALNPLYSCMCRLAENDTKPFVDKLNESKAISVKKHATSLSCVLYDTDTVLSCFKSTTIPSVMAALKYFTKNPSDRLWSLLETKICDVEKKDLQVFKWAVNTILPLEYRSRYVESVWQVLDKYESNEFKQILVTKIDKEAIRRFQPEFAYNILQGSIFKYEEANNFVANVLIHLKDNGKFSLLSKILREFKETRWNNKELQRDSRRKLNKFVLSLFETYMSEKERDKEFASEMATLFKSVFSPQEAFEETVIISCMTMKGESTENWSTFVSELNNHYNDSYGNRTVILLSDLVANHIFKRLFVKDGDKIKFCLCLLKVKKSVSDCLLVITLLPKKEPEDQEHYLLYDDILTELSQVSDGVVNLYFNIYLKSDADANDSSYGNTCCYRC